MKRKIFVVEIKPIGHTDWMITDGASTNRQSAHRIMDEMRDGFSKLRVVGYVPLVK